MLRVLFFTLILFGFLTKAKASHVMGGEITWECQGGNYVFTLVFFRDCDGADVNTVSENIRVWNHPSLTFISLPFISRTDISPRCTPVPGSPPQLDCGIGSGGGNGQGAIEKIIYRSNPIALSGTPPPQGWIFTYESFSRSSSLSNILNPSIYGMTIAAKMYAIPNGTGGSCVDSSPKFLQEPYFVSCIGEPYRYNMNPIDPDLDSLHIEFGLPYNHFPTGIYNPPSNPIPMPFAANYSYLSPTPNTSFNQLNIPAQIDPSSGELTFTSLNQGEYLVKVTVKSYRNKILIAEVEREMQLILSNCSLLNSAPIINAPFAGSSFETTIDAGTLVNFNISSKDVELLQNGSAQSNLLTASGQMFGNNFTNAASGCNQPPCATLNTTPVITGIQGVTSNFNWQTSCDHLLDANGVAKDTIPYHFVFRIQDDYCQVPKVSYATVTINVVNPGVIQAPKINCIQSDASKNVTLKWNPVSNPLGTFVSYQIHSVQNGLLATLPGIGTSSWTDPAVTQKNDYFIAVISGCNGNTIRYSDTVSNIYLQLTNPNNGTAVLKWNAPSIPALNGMNDYFYIYQEYPSGIWTFKDSVPYNTSNYFDTIYICNSFLNYQIVLGNQPCNYTSNVEGDDFQDMLTPSIPLISTVSIDTLTGEVQITWNQNSQPDTYGYIIYGVDANGFLFELDTVYGLGNTSYSYFGNTSLGPLSYSVAAFDSCLTNSIPPTFQTSAKADLHTSIFLTTNQFICSKEVKLSWTPYLGWGKIDHYEVYTQLQGGSWQLSGNTTGTQLTIPVQSLKNYCFFIKGISTNGQIAFSNKFCLNTLLPKEPAFHYLQLATVDSNLIVLKHLIDASSGVKSIRFEKRNSNGTFDFLEEVFLTGTNQITLTDTDVDVYNKSYTYRARLVDSCGNIGTVSNIATSILLTIEKNDVKRLTYLNWNPYSDFNGAILYYNIYRGIDGVFTTGPIANLSNNTFSFEDDLNAVTFTGKVCYYIEAVEGSNLYNDPQISRSNIACEIFEPIIYIPNAFYPDGVNKTFKPVLDLFNPTNYQFTIINRWGQVVFLTNSPSEAWNGYINSTNSQAETGTYIYMVKLIDGNGIEIIKRGHVTLLR